MQIILTQPATEDINMTTQAESPVKGNMSEIRQEINQAFKIDEDTIAALEKSLSNEASVISKDIVLEEEKVLDNSTNINTNSIPEDIIKKDGLSENINSDISKIIPNGAGCTQDNNKSESNIKKLEITNEEESNNIDENINKLVTEKAVDLDIISVTNNISNTLKCLTKLEEKSDLAKTDKPSCEKSETKLMDTNKTTVSVNITEPINSLEKDVMDTDSFTMDEELKETSEVIKNVSSPKTEQPDLTTTDVKDPDEIETNEEIKNMSEKSDNIEINTIPNSSIDEEVTDMSFLENEDVSMQEVNNICTVENAVLPEKEKRKSVKIDEKTLVLVKADENVILSETEDLEPVKMDEEEMLPLQENLNNDSEQNKNKEESQDTTVADTKATLVYPAGSDDHLKNFDASHLNSTKTSLENKELCNEKNIENVAMEVDNIETVNVIKESLENESNEQSNATSNNVVSKDTTVEDIAELGKITPEIPEGQNNSENIIISKDVESSEAKDNANSEIASEMNLEKQATGDYLATKDTESSSNIRLVSDEKNDVSIEKEVRDCTKENQDNVEILDEDDVKIVDSDEDTTKMQTKKISPEREEPKPLPVVCKLMNTLDILSDDEEETQHVATNESQTNPEEKQCINLDDDDDIMLIEEDPKDKLEESITKPETEQKQSDKIDIETGEKHTTDITDLMPKVNEKDSSPDNISKMELDSVPESEAISEIDNKTEETKKPLLPQNFLKTAKKNLAGMSRHELEDFCILRIVESIVDRSNLSDIKTQIKVMAQTLEEYKKRTLMMTKQNRDLQVVLKSVQEEQKKRTNAPIQPLKITRSVGMQVSLYTVEKNDPRKKTPAPNTVQPPTVPTGRLIRSVPNAKQIKPPGTPGNIPVPRKVPVNNSPAKALVNTPANSLPLKSASPNSNGLKNPSPVQKPAEKRTHNRIQSSSFTVDLTDDEPPTKISNKNLPSHPVRVVPSQNLLAQQRQFPPLTNVTSRKVYIPISGPQGQIRANQLVMKNVVNPGPRPGQRLTMPRAQQAPIRPKQTTRHPAPLPESMKQYTPPTWKALPPAPDLKLSKVENGIVISWKIDGYSEGGYETIASYQLYAYQETSSPPCTALWKKIGDVKALPLPMACTLTQFMAGFKYYFAVRAVDVRSRLGPFSLPGSILLLNKV